MIANASPSLKLSWQEQPAPLSFYKLFTAAGNTAPEHRLMGTAEVGMTTDTTKLQAAESDLKRLMADVAQAVEKAQQAVARITGKAATSTDETQAATSSLADAHSGAASTS